MVWIIQIAREVNYYQMVELNIVQNKLYTYLYYHLILGYDSDEDVFSSAPTSPCSEYSSSEESSTFHNAELDFSYLLFSR